MTDPSYEELKARLPDLKSRSKLKKRSGTMEFKVSEKGGVSVYGLGRFPSPCITSNGRACLTLPRTFGSSLKKTNPDSNSKASKPEQPVSSISPPPAARADVPARSRSGSQNAGLHYYVIAEYDTSHWLQNLRASPDVRVRVGKTSFAARARILTSEKDLELLRAVQQLSRRTNMAGATARWLNCVLSRRPDSNVGSGLCAPDRLWLPGVAR